VAKDGGDLHLRGFFLGDGYPSKVIDNPPANLGAIKFLRGWGFSFFGGALKRLSVFCRYPGGL
jgi:hypothetical protein